MCSLWPQPRREAGFWHPVGLCQEGSPAEPQAQGCPAASSRTQLLKKVGWVHPRAGPPSWQTTVLGRLQLCAGTPGGRHSHRQRGVPKSLGCLNPRAASQHAGVGRRLPPWSSAVGLVPVSGGRSLLTGSPCPRVGHLRPHTPPPLPGVPQPRCSQPHPGAQPSTVAGNGLPSRSSAWATPLPVRCVSWLVSGPPTRG